MKKFSSLAIAALLLIVGFAADASSEDNLGLPAYHMIANVPWHQQMNGLFCGEGVLEEVYDYYGPDINQKAIADAARSSSAGTWSFDMVRAGHFSNMSSAQGRFFPHDSPESGYPERALGYASFPYSSDKFWLADLKSLIAADTPVILLMTFEPNGGGGHYRTAIGYDDSMGIIYFSDPWGRDQKHQTNKTGITAWTYEELQSGWNYTAEGESHPYWGMVMMPWSVNVKISGPLKPGSNAIVTADIAYHCPPPFNASMYPAKDAVAMIILPEGISLDSGSTNVFLGKILAGSDAKSAWKVRIDEPVSGKTIMVRAQGKVSGQVPEAHWTGVSVSYPPYIYTDAIGGNGSVLL
ncbi:Peptidase_C39 like family protein [uncultured archaeon]|nr:Peptidase_C39 like family protein [uncultured archaeon]